MTNAQIKRTLIEKGVSNLYHANTVETSLSFFNAGGLLSRGLCKDMGYPQTAQYSDKSDKRYNIFYDIFFDSMEIQRRTGVSYYGPVLFVYNLDVLDTIPESHIRITKKNPDRWSDTKSDAERYFCDYKELTELFDGQDFGQHITLTNQRQPLSFEYLDKIILSDPHKEDNTIFETAREEIEFLMKKNELNASLRIRAYSYNDRFYETYADDEKVIKHFGLGGHR